MVWCFVGHDQGTVAGAVLLLELTLNRETRDALPPAEQSYLHDGFKYTGAGLALTAFAARSMFKSSVAFRIMSANPCVSCDLANPASLIVKSAGVVLGVGLAGSIGSMIGVFATSPENTVAKHFFWLVRRVYPSSAT